MARLSRDAQTFAIELGWERMIGRGSSLIFALADHVHHTILTS
jgi:hypothetical protein